MRLSLCCATLVLAGLGCGPAPATKGLPNSAQSNATPKEQWLDVKADMYEFQVSHPRTFALTRRPFVDSKLPVGVRQIEEFSAEKFDKDGLSHSFAIVAGRLGQGAKKTSPLNEMLRQANIPNSAKRSAPREVMWSGKPAIELICEVDESPGVKKLRIVTRQLATDTVAYVGIIRHPGDITVDEENRFWDSFKLIAGAAPKK